MYIVHTFSWYLIGFKISNCISDFWDSTKIKSISDLSIEKLYGRLFGVQSSCCFLMLIVLIHSLIWTRNRVDPGIFLLKKIMHFSVWKNFFLFILFLCCVYVFLFSRIYVMPSLCLWPNMPMNRFMYDVHCTCSRVLLFYYNSMCNVYTVHCIIVYIWEWDFHFNLTHIHTSYVTI